MLGKAVVAFPEGGVEGECLHRWRKRDSMLAVGDLVAQERGFHRAVAEHEVEGHCPLARSKSKT